MDGQQQLVGGNQVEQQTIDMQVQTEVQETQNEDSPTDIAQAFKLLRDRDKNITQSSVENRQSDDGQSDRQPEQDKTNQSILDTTPNRSEQSQSMPEINVGNNDGGSADVYTNDQVNALSRKVIQDAQQRAASEVNKLFKENKIEKFSINKLYQRNEQTGQVTFINPDDPNRPFQSRAEADAWITAMNNQIDGQWKLMVQQQMQQELQNEKPYLDFIAFIPTFEAMDNATKDIFDELVSPYAITNSNGEVRGFKCDLATAARQAKAIAAHFTKVNEVTPPAAATATQTATGPAVDAKTSGSESSNVSNQPKSLEEAMKLLNKKGK